MSKRVASSSLNSFKISGEIDELSPQIKTGLVSHINFEGGISYKKTPIGTKVLVIGMKHANISSAITALTGASVIVTERTFSNVTDANTAILALTDNEILSYDVIYITFTSRSVSSDVSNKIYDIITRLGISILSDGNDTASNRYHTSSYTPSNIGGTVTYNDIGIKFNSVKENADNRTYISSVPDYVYPFGVMNQYIMSYYVEETSGYIHNQNMSFSSGETVEVISFLASKSYGRIKAPNIRYNNDGAVMMNTINHWNDANKGGRTPNSSEYIDFLPNLPFGENTDNKVYKFTPLTTMSYNIRHTNSSDFPSGTVFYFGAWCFIENSCDIDTSRVMLVGEQITRGSATFDLAKKGEWQYMSFKSTSTGNGFYFLLYPSHGNGKWSKGNIYFMNPTIYANAQHKHNVDFCEGRYAYNHITIEGTNTKNFTIILKRKIMDDFRNMPSPSGENIINMYDGNTSKKIFYNNYKGTNGGLTPLIGHDDYVTNTSVYWHWHQVADFMPSVGKIQYLVICKDGDKMYINSYVDGVVKSNYCTYTEAELKNFSLKSIEISSYIHSYIQDVMLYNTAIKMDDIKNKMLSKNPLSINLDGNLNNKTIIEGNGNINSNDIVYFPLDNSSNDYTGMYKASLDDTNILYDSNCATVSHFGIENLHKMEMVTPSLDAVIKVVGNTAHVTVPKNSQNYGGMRISSSTNSIKVESNTTYMIEFEYTSNIETRIIYDINNNVTGSTSNDNDIERSFDDRYNQGYHFFTSPGKWKKFRVYYKVPVGVTFNYIFDTIGLSGNENDISFSVRNIIFRTAIRKGMELTTLINGNIKGSKLGFDLHNSIGLNWQTDWTIMYGKRMHATLITGNTTTASYSIDSIGCNSNTVGDNYAYWGRSNNVNDFVLKADTHYTKAISSITSFIDYWNIVIIMKRGNVIIFKCISENGIVAEMERPLTVSKPDAFSTQHGYDLMLGGWDYQINGCYSFRDLIVAKRGLSDSEIELYCKRFFKSTSDILNVNNEVCENQSL